MQSKSDETGGLSTLFSNAVITKSLTGEAVSTVNVGEMVQIKLELKDHTNNPISSS